MQRVAVLGRRLCLERQDLSEPVEGRLRDHRHPLERTEILRPARQAIEGIRTMKAGSTKSVRCAIYTRVSTDQGLEQDFNSLDAQYDASQAYIRSQAHAGWTLLRAKYDDGGFSGGNTDRPALQRLLEDVRAGKIDVIVVYKVDRLTRSLADFAKLVELFDRAQCVLRLGHPAVQHHHLDGPADAERAAVVCPVRARGHLRAHPGQDRRLQAQGSLGRRHGAARLRHEGPQDHGQRAGGRDGSEPSSAAISSSAASIC